MRRTNRLGMAGWLLAVALARDVVPVRAAETVLNFSGTDSYVALGMPAALQLPSSGPFTVEGWMFLRTVDARDMLYSKNTTRTTGGYSFLFGFMDNGDLALYSPASNWVKAEPETNIATERWYHVAVSYDGTHASFYLNGEACGIRAFSFANVENNTVKLGGYYDQADINGMKSEVRIWNYARSEQEIKDTQYLRLTGHEPGLLGYWPLNEGSGEWVFDKTGGGATGTVINASWATDDSLELSALKLMHPVTGSMKFTNTNEVDLLDMAVPEGYSHYQTTFSTNRALLDAEGWLPTNLPPERIVFPQPLGDTNLAVHAWFTNLTQAVPLQHLQGSIRYTQTAPQPRVHAALQRHLVEGFSSVVLNLEDIDDGSTGGMLDDQVLALYSLGISCAADNRPGQPEVELTVAGTFDVVLTAVNEAGNSATATCTVSVAEGELRTWTGLAGDGLASTDGNWQPATAPITGQSVRLDDTSSAPCTWDLDIVLASWTQTAEYAGTVTFATVYPGAGTFTNLVIARGATVQGGTWTHPANSGGATERERLALTVHGDFTLGAAARINLDGRGFAAATGPGAGTGGATTGGYSASHGGAGARTPAASGTHGSVTRPVNLGSGADGRGGGALRLTVGGTATLDGVISAQGVNTRTSSIANYCHGAGGAILIEAGVFAGTGTVQAGIDTNTPTYYGSGGGRIALISGSTDGFDGLTLTAHTHPEPRDGGGRAGTVYLETPAFKHLIIDQHHLGTASDNQTDLPPRLAVECPHPAYGGELEDVTLIITNGGFAGLARDLRVGAIGYLDGTLSLNAWTLYVKSGEPASFPLELGGGVVAPSGVYYSFDNGDTLVRDGRILWSDAPVQWRAVSTVYNEMGGSTAIDGGVAEGYYDPDSELAFGAAEDAGYAFMHWEGDVPGGVISPDNPLAPGPLTGNVALRAWFHEQGGTPAINTWTLPASSAFWDDPRNWSLLAAPVDGQNVVLGPGSNVLLTNDTPVLAAFSMTGGTLTFTNWTTRLRAETVELQGGTLTLPPAFTETQMSNRVWIVAGQVTIGTNAMVDANYKGYDGENGPGRGAHDSTYGPGGGYGGQGGFSQSGAAGGLPYGSTTAPEAPGSGGADGNNIAGGGGGAVRIDAPDGTVTVFGTITANGQYRSGIHAGSGSGGAIWITCRRLEGSPNGLLRANGGNNSNGGGPGGGGRIAVVYDSTAQNGYNPGVRFQADHGTGGYATTDNPGRTAENGTLYLPDGAFLAASLEGQFLGVKLFGPTAWSPGTLNVMDTRLLLAQEGFQLAVTGDIVLGAGAQFGLGAQGVLTCRNLTLADGAKLSLHAGATNGAAPGHGCRLSVSDKLNIGAASWLVLDSDIDNGGSPLIQCKMLTLAATGGIDASYRGWGNFRGPGAGSGTSLGSGAGYGGAGSKADTSSSVGGPAYGWELAPTLPGSGGGHNWGGRGGGLIRLEIDGHLNLEGALLANGRSGVGTHGGGGAGGGIFVTCRSMTSGTESRIEARGGNLSNRGGGGGGGRVAFWVNLSANARQHVLTGQPWSSLHQDDQTAPFYEGVPVTVAGGSATTARPGEPGTIRWVWSDATPGTIIYLR